MAFAEDLSLFFDPGEFAVAATLKTAAGVTLRTANVIFDTPDEELQVFDGVQQQHPFFECATADLADVKKGCLAVIEGTTYVVTRRHNPGTGTSFVYLRKQ